MWNSISLETLNKKILAGETALKSDIYGKELFVFWSHIKTQPEKWNDEDGYSEEGNGFYIVAISGRRVIWYNDIEDGFNISFYNEYGIIRDYMCEQYGLNHAVYEFYNSGLYTGV